MKKQEYIKSLNPAPKPAVKRSDRRLKMSPAELVVMLDQHVVDLEKLQDKNKALNEENNRLTRELDEARAGDEAINAKILEKVNGLASAFSFHMDTNTMAVNALSANNTMAVNALSANIANLVNKVK